LTGEVIDIDLDASRVTVDTIGQRTQIAYDSLIVATGASQSYFGHPESARDAPGIKTIDHALELRGRIFGAFEMAESETDPAARRRWLTFVVVGAGATGVELAGQLADLSHRSLRGNFRHIDPADARVVLLDAAPTILPAFPDALRERLPKTCETWESKSILARWSLASTSTASIRTRPSRRRGGSMRQQRSGLRA